MICTYRGKHVKAIAERVLVWILIPCGLSLFAMPGIAGADTLDYTWLEGGYQRVVADEFGQRLDAYHGEFVAGSYALTDQFDLHGDYHDQQDSSQLSCGETIFTLPPPGRTVTTCVETSQKEHGYGLGLGWHYSFAETADLIAALDYTSDTTEDSATVISTTTTPGPAVCCTPGNFNDFFALYTPGHYTGARGYVGVRVRVASRVELDGVFGRTHTSNGVALFPAYAYDFLDGTAVFSFDSSWSAVLDVTHEYVFSREQANIYRLGLRYAF